MKVVLLNTKDGSLLQKLGHYTRQIDEAKAFETTAYAAEFRSEYNLMDHNVVLQFAADRLDISFLNTYRPSA